MYKKVVDTKSMCQWLLCMYCIFWTKKDGPIAFESPVAKVYNTLPPPVEDLDEVLAVLFTGPCQPTREEL